MKEGLIESELREHGVYASNTFGTSMRPLFKTHRDMIIVKAPDSELRKYDVALYVSARGKYILHRVIGVKDAEYLIRGDNTYSVEHVPKDRVIGVLVKFNRKGKTHTTDEFSYKIYSRFWHFIYPVRFVLRKIRLALGKIYRALFKRKAQKTGATVSDKESQERLVRSLSEYVAALLTHVNCGMPKPEKPKEIPWEAVFAFSHSQSLASGIYSAIEADVKREASPELAARWDRARATDLAKHIKQASEFKRLTALFTEKGIKFLPLKGFTYKALWKNPAHRTMSDLDIYFDPDDMSRVDELLLGLGYVQEHSCDVHLSYEKKPFLNVEAHRKFEENGESPSFDTWQTKPDNPYWHIMNHEQFLTFNALHAYKHYEAGGCGMRVIFDLYLYKKAYENEMSVEILQKSLAKEGLSDFFSLIEKVADYWFSGAEPTDEVLTAAYYISTGGTYGSMENRISYGIESKGRGRYILSRVFPPYAQMKLRYPVLKKLPVLLPFMYIVRFITSIFNGRNGKELRGMKKHKENKK